MRHHAQSSKKRILRHWKSFFWASLPFNSFRSFLMTDEEVFILAALRVSWFAFTQTVSFVLRLVIFPKFRPDLSNTTLETFAGSLWFRIKSELWSVVSYALHHLALDLFPRTTSAPLPPANALWALAFLLLNKISVHFDVFPVFYA